MVLIRIFGGGSEGCQVLPLLTALKNESIRQYNTTTIEVEILYHKQIVESHMTEEQIATFCAECDIYIIATHPHQALEHIHASKLHSLLAQKLTGRLGFPEYLRGEIQCPVITQDKFTYLKHLPSSMVNPTVAVRLCTWYTVNDYENNISPVLKKSCASTDGWIVKFPYVTNSEGMSFYPDSTGVCQKLYRSSLKYEGRIPYAMIQPRIDRKEYKVVCFNKVPQYITGSKKGGKAFSNPLQIMDFAGQAIRAMQLNCPTFVCDGLIRVDIMCSNDNRLIVNEFESFEALYTGSSDTENCRITQLLVDYWVKKLLVLLEKFHTLS